ncbi:MAG TPA: TadE/TadG family type IV pilus assembly protein [Rhizomicrobium sp.]|jgi:Flp pilus assembly protein TadG
MMSRTARGFLRAKDGLAAIEFAFIAPILIVLFFGTIEVCNALICRQKVTTMASSAADLVAQDSAITGSQVNDVFSAINAIVYPYPSTGAKIIITSLIGDPLHAGKYVVDWSVAQNTTAHTKGASMNVPTGLLTVGGSVILAEITYTYNSHTTEMITGPLSMSDIFYARPRKGAQVKYTP